MLLHLVLGVALLLRQAVSPEQRRPLPLPVAPTLHRLVMTMTTGKTIVPSMRRGKVRGQLRGQQVVLQMLQAVSRTRSRSLCEANRLVGRHAKRQEDLPYCDELTSGSGSGNTNAEFTPISSFGGGGNRRTMLIAHGVLAALAFVILFPSGAIAIRLASFTGVVWLHAAFQVFAFLVYIAAFGLGVYLATEMNMIDHHHPIIGIVVLVLLFFQPILGFLHHLFFKKYTSRTLWSYAHIWTGRIAVTIGIINGGLGLRWADSMGLSSKGGIIAYGVIAGLVWVVWVAAIVVGESRRKRAIANAPPKDSGSPRQASLRSDEAPVRSDEAPVNGHYAPKQG